MAGGGKSNYTARLQSHYSGRVMDGTRVYARACGGRASAGNKKEILAPILAHTSRLQQIRAGPGGQTSPRAEEMADGR